MLSPRKRTVTAGQHVALCQATLYTAMAIGLLSAATAVAQPTPKVYPPAPVTAWAPVGCRGVPYTDAVTPLLNGWHNLHGDGICSDEVSIALAPVFSESWTAEPTTFNPTGPVFDSQGHLYFAPLLPHENVVLISLDAATGARRWAVPGTGAAAGGGAPMVLRDPDNPGAELIYVALYDRVLAVRTDGSVLWDVPSGLPSTPADLEHIVSGIQHVAGLDAIMAVTRDGWIFGVDRRTGAPVLHAPFQLPGVATPPGAPLPLPPSVVTAAEDILQGLVQAPDGVLIDLIDLLLGNSSEVANTFAVDPWTDRLWVAATAPDAEDGTVDGVSEFGALYRLGVVVGTAGLQVEEVCHRSFAGGSASTPTLSRDGRRVYLGDNFGKLLAIEDDCGLAWEIDLGAQIFGSVAVASDGNEVYASTRAGVKKVRDLGPTPALEWAATIDPYENLDPGQVNLNLSIVAVAANGLAFQAGAGRIFGIVDLPATVGVGILDRETGQIRAFADGGDETVAPFSTGPDGLLYMGNSPVRRLIANVLGLSPEPIRGGITKFAPQRLDLLMRDAACAGAARALNAWEKQELCPDSAAADIVQLRELIAQIRASAGQAIAAGDLTPRRWKGLDRRLMRAEARLDRAATQLPIGRGLRRAATPLRRICRLLSK